MWGSSVSVSLQQCWSAFFFPSVQLSLSLFSPFTRIQCHMPAHMLARAGMCACIHTNSHTHTDMCLDWMFNSSMTSFPANHYYLPQRKSLNRLPIKHIPTAEVKFATEVRMEFLFYFFAVLHSWHDFVDFVPFGLFNLQSTKRNKSQFISQPFPLISLLFLRKQHSLTSFVKIQSDSFYIKMKARMLFNWYLFCLVWLIVSKQICNWLWSK